MANFFGFVVVKIFKCHSKKTSKPDELIEMVPQTSSTLPSNIQVSKDQLEQNSPSIIMKDPKIEYEAFRQKLSP